VIDVLGELVPEGLSDFFIGFAYETVGLWTSVEVRFVPYPDILHDLTVPMMAFAPSSM
jgi:hypothetical protein